MWRSSICNNHEANGDARIHAATHHKGDRNRRSETEIAQTIDSSSFTPVRNKQGQPYTVSGIALQGGTAAWRARPEAVGKKRNSDKLTRGQRTKRPIPDVRKWLACTLRRIDYFLKQVLTGTCPLSRSLAALRRTDTAKHTYFISPKCHETRTPDWSRPEKALDPGQHDRGYVREREKLETGLRVDSKHNETTRKEEKEPPARQRSEEEGITRWIADSDPQNKNSAKSTENEDGKKRVISETKSK